MFKIREQHMEAQSKANREGFEDRLVEFLCGEFPEAKDEPPAELRSVVHEQVERALGYGLSMERHVAIYLTTAWLLGRDFDSEFPRAKQILTEPLMSPDDRAQSLAKFTEQLFVALEEEG